MTPMGGVVFSAGLDSLGGQECTPFSPEIPHNGQNGPKSPQKGGGGPPFFVRFLSCTSIIFFMVPVGAPKWCFFNPNMGTGFKKHHFGACIGSPKKIIEVQVGHC